MKTKQDVYASVSYRDVWMALEPAASPPDMRTVQRPRPASDWAPDAAQPEMPTARHPAPAPRHAGVTSLQGIHLAFLCILVFDRCFLRDGVLRNSRGSLYLSQLWLIAANILPRLPNHHDISACLLATTRYCTPLRMACTTQYTSM
jgi:hypothetical protein